MTTQTNMHVLCVVAAATIGSIAGAVVLYTIGRVLSVERVERLFTSRLGRLLRFKKEDVRKTEEWFQKHGKLMVFFCRFIPIVRSLTHLSLVFKANRCKC